MANRYWVGGTATWDNTAGSKWSTTSGGPGGASAPVSTDDVFFDSNSTGTCTVAGGAVSKSLNFTGFTGTFAGSVALIIFGSLTISAGMVITNTGGFNFAGSGTITSAGKVLPQISVSVIGITVQLGDPISTSQINVNAGSFVTNNHSVVAASITSPSGNPRTINLGSSSVQLTGTNPIFISNNTGLTFIAGTSSIVFTNNTLVAVQTGVIGSNGVTFYDVSFSSAVSSSLIYNQNTFNSLTFASPAAAGVKEVVFYASQTILGTLTVPPGPSANARSFLRSNTLGQAVTLTCNAVSVLQDVDFRDIALSGAAVSGGPVSGTRLGNCGGNSGLVFGAAKTVYYVNPTSGDWSSAWSITPGGPAAGSAFPLAQDTAVVQAAYPANFQNINFNASYNIGTIDLSARGAGANLSIVGSAPNVYGDWVGGTNASVPGGSVYFLGRAAQTITSYGVFADYIYIEPVGGSVTLATDLITGLQLLIGGSNGSFDANNKNVTILYGMMNAVSSSPGSINVGSGTWYIGTSWQMQSPFTILGSGTISMTSAGSKSFLGGGRSYANITLEQSGAGQLTITGNNTFKTIASSVTVANTIVMSGHTQTITGQWLAKGNPGQLLTISGGALVGLSTGISANVDYLNVVSNSASPANSWYAGPNSINSGSSGWVFSAAPVSANFFMLL